MRMTHPGVRSGADNLTSQAPAASPPLGPLQANNTPPTLQYSTPRTGRRRGGGTGPLGSWLWLVPLPVFRAQMDQWYRTPHSQFY